MTGPGRLAFVLTASLLLSALPIPSAAAETEAEARAAWLRTLGGRTPTASEEWRWLMDWRSASILAEEQRDLAAWEQTPEGRSATPRERTAWLNRWHAERSAQALRRPAPEQAGVGAVTPPPAVTGAGTEVKPPAPPDEFRGPPGDSGAVPASPPPPRVDESRRGSALERRDAQGRTGGERMEGRARAVGGLLREGLDRADGLDAADGGSTAARASRVSGNGVGATGSGVASAAGSAAVESAAGLRLLQGAVAYKEEFGRAGLAVREDAKGNPQLYNVRESRPATEPERTALLAAVSASPAALMREPGLYASMPRQEYAAMRTQVAARGPAAEGPLKDVGISADGRDLVWSRSCDKVTGKCNDSADRSYQAGQAVRGAELSRMWAKARTALAAGAGRSSTPLSLDRSLLRRIFGKRDSGAQAGEPVPAPGAAAPGQSARGVVSDAERGGAADGAAPAPQNEGALALGTAVPGARSLWWPLCALVGTLLLLTGLRRRP